MEQNVIGSLTELYIGGGDSWITEAYPTNFHTFHKRKVLTPTESVTQWKEVTSEEKAALEKSDAQWVRPSDDLICQFNLAAEKFGGYNPNTGFFECNDILDITAVEAHEMLLVSGRGNYLGNDSFHSLLYLLDLNPRALLPIRLNGLISNTLTNFCRGINASVLTLLSFWGRNRIRIEYAQDMITYCYNLKRIVGILDLDRIRTENTQLFSYCPVLEDFQILGLTRSINIATGCPKVSLASIDYMVTNAINTAPITITLHPDAYARLTDELIATAADKQITFVTTT